MWDQKNIVLFKKTNKPLERLCYLTYFLRNLYMKKDKILLFTIIIFFDGGKIVLFILLSIERLRSKWQVL